MYLSPRDNQIIDDIIFDQHVTIQAAAYAVYVELTPKNRKPISSREFHTIVKDNWKIFNSLELEETEQDR